MNLLAIETATEACSVALWVDGEVLERHEVAPRRHTELVLPWAQALLAEAGLARSQLDAIACGRGPGAFTGVRLAVAITQGLALALDRPVLAVSTLAALALEAEGHDSILAAIDARMGEVYAGLFGRDAEGLVSPLGEERIGAPATLALPGTVPLVGVGTGFAAEGGVLRERLAARLLECRAEALPHAAAVARLGARAFRRGEAVAPERLEPAYLREKVALTLSEQGKGVESRDRGPETGEPGKSP
ncbi:tRNA (adenosine(37)-N6)-threonylcarbamoyltransferase complex dimerization subunit type 1 TsaB [Rehaibacterium terrae]|uniref:tRNA threonylcarbamoyladenosine biosynthesis protein TsaB n=1 Tax=Rehaibacterium terrae TaxID=1341696 RepID=A0A7W7Y0P4_9GAMM|nr:tRNA (adenosine(37)-N6)-threonylcarbamoyltransferase complex dimerization subunit type 1 TsaB [Rehaibacterium terrae]MBB5015954.1 tRNA threonylcarbamoyladenosine biosynthesis protein TsaB [Rehaibacterium terrae]